jgi:hypothetical protein
LVFSGDYFARQHRSESFSSGSAFDPVPQRRRVIGRGRLLSPPGTSVKRVLTDFADAASRYPAAIAATRGKYSPASRSRRFNSFILGRIAAAAWRNVKIRSR